MAISDNYSPTRVQGNSITDTFTFTWNGISTDNLKVYFENVSTGAITEQSVGFTKALNADPSTGGQVVFTTPPPATVYVIIARDTPKSHTQPYRTSSGFPAKTVELDFDKIVAMLQESTEFQSRAISFPLGTDVDALGYSTLLPTPADDFVLGWASGELTNVALGAGVDLVLATQAEAEAGTNNTHFMSPLRVAQAISALVTPSTLPEGFLYGGIIQNDSTDPTNDLSIGATICRDDGDAVDMDISAMIKRVDATWVAGTNQGGLDTGTIGASADIVYIWAISEADGSNGDYLLSKSDSAPTMPSGYTKKRLLGGRRWTGSAWELFTTVGTGVEKTVYMMTGGEIVTNQKPTSYTDADASAFIPTTSKVGLFNGRNVMSTGSNANWFVRPNGSTATSEANFRGSYDSGTSVTSLRVHMFFEMVLDASLLFEYAVADGTNAGLYIYVLGYREQL